jgi:hypothetical protein
LKNCEAALEWLTPIEPISLDLPLFPDPAPVAMPVEPGLSPAERPPPPLAPVLSKSRDEAGHRMVWRPTPHVGGALVRGIAVHPWAPALEFLETCSRFSLHRDRRRRLRVHLPLIVRRFVDRVASGPRGIAEGVEGQRSSCRRCAVLNARDAI